MIVLPDLNQARVNKCLIALVNRKIVTKDNSTVGEKTYLLIRCDTESRYFISQRGTSYTIGKVWRHESRGQLEGCGCIIICLTNACRQVTCTVSAYDSTVDEPLSACPTRVQILYYGSDGPCAACRCL